MSIYEFKFEPMRDNWSSCLVSAVVIALTQDEALSLMKAHYSALWKDDLETDYAIEINLIGLAIDTMWPQVVSVEVVYGPGA